MILKKGSVALSNKNFDLVICKEFQENARKNSIFHCGINIFKTGCDFAEKHAILLKVYKTKFLLANCFRKYFLSSSHSSPLNKKSVG